MTGSSTINWRQAETSWAQKHRLGQLQLEHQRSIHNPHYTIQAARISPKLDPGRLGRAWAAVVHRHPVLSSTFTIDSKLWLLPTGQLPTEQVECQASEFKADLRRPFDYGNGPVSRLVFAEDADSTLVGVSIEHLISDGWSLATVWEDLITAYNDQTDSQLPEDQFLFAEHIDREADRLGSAQTAQRVEHLRRTLAPVGGAIPALNLPSRRDRDAGSAVTGKKELKFSVSAEDWRGARTAGRIVKLSGPNLILAAYHAALAEFTNRQQVGTTLTQANRTRARHQRAVGWYAGKIVIYADTATSKRNPHSFLGNWREKLWDSLDYGDIPWAFLLSRLNPDDFGSFTTVPYATFNFQPNAMARPVFGRPWRPADKVSVIDVPAGSRETALSSFWIEDGNSIDVLWQYQPAVISAASADQLQAAFDSYLRHFVRSLLGDHAGASSR